MANLDVSVIIRAIDRATAPMKNMMRGMRNIEKASERFNQRMQRSMAMGFAGDAALRMSRAATKALTGPINTMATFEQQMARVGAISKATDEDFAKLQKTARKLGGTTTFSATEAAQGMEFLSMAGFKANETIAAMPGLLNLAKAGATDLGRTADIASDILSGFGMTAKQTGRMADVLASTTTGANTTLELLGDTMKYVGPLGADAGASIEQVAAMAGKLGDVGIKGSVAGTTLKALFLRLSAEKGQAQNALEPLGIELSDEEGNLRDVVEILKEINEVTKDMGSRERASIMKDAFGAIPIAGITALTKVAGSGDLQKFQKDLENSAGAAQKMATRMDDTMTGRFKGLASALESLALTAFEPMKPLIQGITESLIRFTRWLEKVSATFPTLTKWLSLGAVGFIGVAGTAGIALKVGAGLIAIYASVARSFATVVGVVPKLAMGLRFVGTASLNMGKKMVIGALTGIRAMSSGLITLATRGIPAALAGLRSLTVALLTNPVGLAVAGIGIAATLLVKYWEPVKGFFLNIWSKVEPYWKGFADWAGGLWDLLSEKFAGFGEIIQEYILGPLSTVLDAVGSVGNAVGGFFGFGEETTVPSPAKKAAQAVALGTALAVTPVAAQQTQSVNTIPNTVIKEMKKTVNIQPGAIVINLSFPKDADISNPESMANEMANSLQTALDNVARRSFYDDDDLG
jgi:TP901 family phage tail tape measure protein